MVNSDYVKYHEWTHTGEKPFECQKCDYRCKNQKTLEIHMIKHQTDKNEVKLIRIHLKLKKKTRL